jgi:hypothetical protein
MTKGIKVVFIVSIILNVCLLIGLISFRMYHTYQSFRLVAESTKAEVQITKYILSELESDNPEKIAALKDWLQKNIENGQKTAQTWQQATESVK